MHPARFLRATVPAACALLAVACGSSATPASAPAAKPAVAESSAAAAPAQASAPAPAPPAAEKITIGLPATTIAHLPIYLAKAIGAFERQGLDAEITLVRPPLQMAALTTDEVQFVTTTGVPLAGAYGGYDVKIIGVVMPGPLFQWVVRPEVTSVQDVRGKRVGVNSVGTTDYQIVMAVLRKYGLEDSATVLGLGDTPIIAESLKNGSIDVASMSPPWPAKMRREGYPILLNVNSELDIPQAGLSTTAQRIAEQREQVKRVLRAEIEAVQFIHANRPETVKIIGDTFEMDAATAEESYESAAPAFSPALRPSEAGIFTLANEVLANTPQAGTLTAAEVYARTVDPRPAEEVQAELGIR